MSNFDSSIRVLRYLFALRVNSGIVRLSSYPPLEFSLTLAAIIADRLPTQDAAPWRKLLDVWQANGSHLLQQLDMNADALSNPQGKKRTKAIPPPVSVAPSQRIPDLGWPIQSVLHVYPGKQVYGQGEIILCEIKLLGKDAEHRLFLETLLPALEAGGYTRDRRWGQVGKLWGNYDIDAVYVARGLQWQPLVQRGKIDLRIQPSALQWQEGLPLIPVDKRALRRLTWLTPFSFGPGAAAEQANRKTDDEAESQQKGGKKKPLLRAPTLSQILAVTGDRLEQLTPGWREAKRANALAWKLATEQAQNIATNHYHLDRVPKQQAGLATGMQTFTRLPSTIVPFLSLAAVVHVGEYTHLGCGTFVLGE